MLSRNEMKELLRNGNPVIYHDLRLNADIECKCISAIITRYNPKAGDFEVTLELLDRNNNSVLIVLPKDVRRKEE